LLIAITRPVSPSIALCDLEHLERQPIDASLARRQHEAYQRCLTEMGASVAHAPAEDALPDAVFVEDPALVFDDFAVMTSMKSPRRQLESASLAECLRAYRPLEVLGGPGTLEGGDVMRVGHDLYVGLSNRTTLEGIEQLRRIVEPRGYRVHAIEMQGCLHLKSACCYLGDGTVVANRSMIVGDVLDRYRILEVPADEPMGGNVLAIGRSALVPAAFPGTAALIEKAGWQVMTSDTSELM